MKIKNFQVAKIFNNIYFASLFLALSLIYFFSGIFIGLDFTDSFYHLNQAQNPADGVMLYPILLSSLIIKIFIEFVEGQVIYLRFINALLYILALLLPFIFLKTKATLVKKMFYIGLVIFLITPLNANVLGYDTLSIFLNSAIFTFTIYYLRSRNYYLIGLLSLLCSLAILTRLPNVVVVPILILVIFYKEKLTFPTFKLSILNLPFLYLLLTVTGVILGYFLYYKNLASFTSSSLGSISHNYKILVYRYLRDSYKVMIFITFIIGSYFLFKKLYGYFGKLVSYIVVFSVYIVFIKLYLFPGYPYTIFLTALVFAMVIIYFYEHWTCRKDRTEDIFVLTIFPTFLFINAFGSNLGLLKTSFLFLLLPFVLSVVSIKSINFWKFLMIILIPAAAYLKFYKTYEDQNIFKLNKTLNIELLGPIKTNEERYIFLNDLDRAVKKMQGQGIQVFFYGDKSHIFHYLYPNTSLGIKAFNQPVNNLIFLDDMEERIKNRGNVALFIIPTYPEARVDRENVLKSELQNRGFKGVSEGKIDFLIKTSK